jgi:hypothetical protein
MLPLNTTFMLNFEPLQSIVRESPLSREGRAAPWAFGKPKVYTSFVVLLGQASYPCLTYSITKIPGGCDRSLEKMRNHDISPKSRIGQGDVAL